MSRWATFDCYGTLIDWNAGIRGVLESLFGAERGPELLRAARWRAARHGIGGQLFDPVLGVAVDARLAIRRLLAELEDDLRGRSEWAEVSELVARLLSRGTSAARQREIWLRTGDRREIAARMVAAGASA